MCRFPFRSPIPTCYSRILILRAVGLGPGYYRAMFSLLIIYFSLLTGCQLATAVSSKATCFSINGQPNTDFPCFLGQSVSACCGTDSICLDNGLCKPVDSVGVSELIRGSCTDETWLSPSCPNYCVGKCVHSPPFSIQNVQY